MSFKNKLFGAKQLVALAVAIMMLFGATTAFAAKLSGELKVSGSTTVLPLCQELAKDFMKKNKGVKISITAPGSSAGIKELQAGKVPMAMSSRSITAAEVSGGLVAYEIAREALVIVVHPKNKVKKLTSAQVKDIFLGKITNWKEVGGADAPIMPQGRDSASGTYEYFNEHFLGKGVKPDDSVKQHASNGLVREAVSKNKNAVGYVAFNYLNSKVKPVALDGADATKKNLGNGKYKVIRPLFFVTKGKAAGLAKAFIDYTKSAAGKKIVGKEYLLPKK